MKPIRTIEFSVTGEPIGEPRQDGRVIFRAGSRRPSVQMYTPPVRERIGTKPNGKPLYGPDKLGLWKAAIGRACRGLVDAPLYCPLHVHIIAYFPRREYHAGKKFPRAHMLSGQIPSHAILHTAKPDKDNVEKAVLDAMKTAGVYRDDAQVCGGGTFKFYCAAGSPPGIRVKIEVLPTTYDAIEIDQLPLIQEVHS